MEVSVPNQCCSLSFQQASDYTFHLHGRDRHSCQSHVSRPRWCGRCPEQPLSACALIGQKRRRTSCGTSLKQRFPEPVFEYWFWEEQKHPITETKVAGKKFRETQVDLKYTEALCRSLLFPHSCLLLPSPPHTHTGCSWRGTCSCCRCPHLTLTLVGLGEVKGSPVLRGCSTD